MYKYTHKNTEGSIHQNKIKHFFLHIKHALTFSIFSTKMFFSKCCQGDITISVQPTSFEISHNNN